MVLSMSFMGAAVTRTTPGSTAQARSWYVPSPSMWAVRTRSVEPESASAWAAAASAVSSAGASAGGRISAVPAETLYEAVYQPQYGSPCALSFSLASSVWVSWTTFIWSFS